MNDNQAPGNSFLTSTRGISLYFDADLPTQDPRAAVVLVHGFGEYSGRYTALIDQMVAAGFAMFHFDLRGHGRSDGKRGHILRFDDYLNDLATVLEAVNSRKLPCPLFLMGHSLGGLICELYLAERQPKVAGAVVSSPLMGFAIQIPGWKNTLGKLMSRIFPGFLLPNGVDATDLSHQKEVVERYRTDPLIHHVASARWYTETKRAQVRGLELAPQIGCPIRVLQAEEDRLVSKESTQQMVDRLGSEDKQITLYPGLFHEIYNESQGPEIIAEVIQWIGDRAAGQ
ncbi:MAG: lysophospholipase [Bradymonadales bacterium]|nr:lysophospholipase [Bradymonadales bacterium]